MVGYTTITLGTETLNITSIDARKTQKTKKIVLGKNLVETEIIGLNENQWELNLRGYLVGTNATNLYSKRSDLEDLDDLTPYSYSDGIHDGTYYIVPGSLVFDDTEQTAGTGIFLTYQVRLVEQ